MKKTFFLLSLLAISAVSELSATTVGFTGAFPARNVVNSSFSAIGTTSLVLLGNFTTPGLVTLNPALTISANYAAIKAAAGWEEFGLDTVTEAPNAGVTNTLAVTTSPFANKIGGGITDNNIGATKASYFNGKNIYLWVFNATSVASATQMGIFTAATADVPWVFPTNSGGLGDDVSLSTVDGEANMSALIGSVNSTQLILVPEPSVGLLSGIGLIALGAKRRRSRS